MMRSSETSTTVTIQSARALYACADCVQTFSRQLKKIYEDRKCSSKCACSKEQEGEQQGFLLSVSEKAASDPSDHTQLHWHNTVCYRDAAISKCILTCPTAPHRGPHCGMLTLNEINGT